MPQTLRATKLAVDGGPRAVTAPAPARPRRDAAEVPRMTEVGRSGKRSWPGPRERTQS